MGFRFSTRTNVDRIHSTAPLGILPAFPPSTAWHLVAPLALPFTYVHSSIDRPHSLIRFTLLRGLIDRFRSPSSSTNHSVASDTIIIIIIIIILVVVASVQRRDNARGPSTEPPGEVNAGGHRGARRRRSEGASAMGSFKGHALPGTLFLAVGAWHVWAALARFAADPAGFRLRVWNPVEGGGGALRHLELYVVAGGAFVDMCVEVLYSTHLRVFAPSGGVNPAHLNDLEHGGMLLMFFLFGALALLSQKTRYLPLPEGVLCLVAATAFMAEFLLFYFHSTTHQGLEGYYHYLLVVLIGLCVMSTVLGALLPASLPIDLASGVLITLQGLWFYQTAFTLYGWMLPEGCHRDADGHVECHGHAAGERAEQLANFQLFAYVFLVFAYVLGCYAVTTARYGHPDLRTMLAVEVDDAERGGFVGSTSPLEDSAI